MIYHLFIPCCSRAPVINVGMSQGSVQGLLNGKGIWWVEHRIAELEKRLESGDQYCINGIRS